MSDTIVIVKEIKICDGVFESFDENLLAELAGEGKEYSFGRVFVGSVVGGIVSRLLRGDRFGFLVDGHHDEAPDEVISER